MSVNETTRRIVGLSVLVYLPSALLGALWGGLRDGPRDALDHPDPWFVFDSAWAQHGLSVGLGAALALLTVLSSRLFVRRFEWARDLHVHFRAMLGDLPGTAVLLLALLSGIGEELFFRVGMQPTLGWVATSVIFGVVHLGPNRRFLPWTAWAVVMGFLLGGIYEATGSILGPVLAHAWINGANLHHIVAHDPRGPAPTDAPSLVHRRERR